MDSLEELRAQMFKPKGKAATITATHPYSPRVVCKCPYCDNESVHNMYGTSNPNRACSRCGKTYHLFE